MTENSTSIRELLGVLRGGDDPGRAEAMDALLRRRVRKAYPEILAALSDSSATVRWLAVRLIGARGMGDAAGAVAGRLEDEDDEVRWSAAESLGRLLRGTGEAPRGLVRALKDRSALVRVCAAEALGEIGDAKARGALRGRLRDRDPLVRGCAASALGWTGTPEDAELLEAAIAKERRDVAREGMLRALYRLSPQEPVWRQYLRLLESDDYRVRCAVGNSIHLLVSDERMLREAIGALRKALERSSEPAARLDIAGGMRRLRALFAASRS